MIRHLLPVNKRLEMAMTARQRVEENLKLNLPRELELQQRMNLFRIQQRINEIREEMR